jgi:hypothetical protein
MLSEHVKERAKKFQVIDGERENHTPPPRTPGGAKWIPRSDREGAISAFQLYNVSISKLANRQGRKYREIEGVIRDRMDELEARVRDLEGKLRMHLVRRMAA